VALGLSCVKAEGVAAVQSPAGGTCEVRVGIPASGTVLPFTSTPPIHEEQGAYRAFSLEAQVAFV